MEEWNPEGYFLDISMLDGEVIEKIWDDGENLYIKSTLDRVWKSTQTIRSSMRHFDMVEIC